jgi:hypothetical protein
MNQEILQNDQSPVDVKWKRSLIRQEFLKLYFDYLGVNDNLTVEKFTDLYEINRSKKKDKFLFAIVKTKKNPLSDPKKNIYDGRTPYSYDVPIFVTYINIVSSRQCR